MALRSQEQLLLTQKFIQSTGHSTGWAQIAMCFCTSYTVGQQKQKPGPQRNDWKLEVLTFYFCLTTEFTHNSLLDITFNLEMC